MSDTPKQPEQSADDNTVENFSELPAKEITAEDAEAVKGGLSAGLPGAIGYKPVLVGYKPVLNQ